MSIADNLTLIKNTIHTFATRYERDPQSIFLLAASKGQSIAKIREAITAEQFAFGENYLQEGLEKITALPQDNLQWHFIGSLQSNKTTLIAENFSWVHSVSDIHIATRLNQHRPDHLPPINICLQVNISQENTKSGLHTEKKVILLAEEIQNLGRLKLRGLMTIPAIQKTLPQQRAEYKKLRIMFENLRAQGLEVDTLSMGMSDDLEAAIAEGATMVRVGTAIFGKRQ